MSVHTFGQVPVFYVATAGRPTGRERRERCKITADLARRLGFQMPPVPGPLGDPIQVRIGVTQRDAEASTHESYAEHVGTSANFTVDEVVAGHDRVELHPSSRPDLDDGGIGKLFSGGILPVDARVTLWSTAPSSTRVDDRVVTHFAEPAPGRYFREVVETGGADVCVCAPHGGNVEVETSDQLVILKRELRRLGIDPTVWDVQGTWGGEETFRRWHVGSADMQRASFPGLDHLLTAWPPFRYALALHGFRWGERVDDPARSKRGILLGGRASKDAKLALRAAIEEQVGIHGLLAFYIADESAGDASFPGLDGDLAMFAEVAQRRGTSARDVVNRLSPAGLQIEQSLGVRQHPLLAERVALAAARVLAERLSPAADLCCAATA